MAVPLDDRAAHLVGMGARYRREPCASERRRSSGVRSSICSATTWITPDAFCSWPGDGDEPRAEHDRAERLEHALPHDRVGDAGLVFERHEDHALGGAGPLAHQHQPRDGDALAGGDARQQLVPQ